MTPIWENFPPLLVERRQWLLWKLEPKAGQAKMTKMPYYAGGARRAGKQGDEHDRSRLVTLAAARAAYDRGGFEGVGFALLPDDGLSAIDLDHVIDLETGEIRQQALSIIQACGSYTEYSPSGTGFHIIVQGHTTTNKDNGIGVELFCERQYFTFTGNRYADSPADVMPVPAGVFRRLHKTINEAKARRKGAAATPDAGAAAVPTPAPTPGQRPPRKSAAGRDFRLVNEAALSALPAWVPEKFPAAVAKGGGYRITSKALNRPNQEDLSIMPSGIVDFGLEGTGDPKDGRRTPIDLVIEWTPGMKPKEALAWLAKRVGVDIGPPRPAGAGAGAPPRAASANAPDEQGEPQDDFFSNDENGLYCYPRDKMPVRIGAALHVVGWARDQWGNGAALLLEFTDIFGQERRHLLPIERLAGDGAQVRAELNSLGYICPTERNRRGWLLEYLLSRKPTARVRYVPKVGWCGNCFVLPRETLGAAETEQILFWSDAPIEGGMSQKGTAEDWRENLARLAVGNSRLCLCVAMAFAAPLLHWVGVLGVNVMYVFKQVGNEIGGIAAQLIAFAKLDFEGAAFIGQAMKDDAKKAREEVDKLSYSLLGLTNSKAGAGRGGTAATDPRSLGIGPDFRPDLPTQSVPIGGATETAYARLIEQSKEMIASLSLELGANRELTEAEKFRIKFLADVDAAKISGPQRAVLKADLDQISALQELTALRKWDAEAVKVQNQETEKAYQAMLAYSGALDQTVSDLAFETSMLGKNADAQRQMTVLRKLDIEAQRALAAVAGDPALKAQVTAQAEQARMRVLAGMQEQIRLQDELNASWEYGAKNALDDYLKQVKDVAGQTGKLMSSAFKSMEDALVKFVTTGKLDFKGLANGIIADMMRIQIQQSITGPLAASLKAGGGLNGFLGDLLNGGYGGFGGKTGGWNTMGFGGEYANGGSPPVGVPSLVGERGPELFVPKTAGTIVPNGALGQTITLQTNIQIDSRTDRAQVYGDVSRAIQENNRRFADQLVQQGVLVR